MIAGLTELELVLLGLYAVGLALALGSPVWRAVPGRRRGGVLVVPFLIGVTVTAILLVLFRHDTTYLLTNLDERTAWAVLVAVALAGAGTADFLVNRIAALLRRTSGRALARSMPDAVLAAAIGVPMAAAVLATVWVDGRATSGYERSRPSAAAGAEVRAEFELPGQPVDLAMRSKSEGYLSFAEGRIARFVLPERGGRLVTTLVASGLRSPRGIAVVGDTLVVAELGRLPCPEPLPTCKGEHVGGVSILEGERRILRRSRARLLRFAIAPDGGLRDRQVIAADLPVANSDHGVNAVTADAQGHVFVSIGHVDRLVTASLRRERARPRFDLLGTVISLRPDGRELEVVARGLRNVYDLAFDDAGRLYGVDNDGPTRRGWRREEVLEIRRGGHYGYPYDGTFGPYTRRTVPPLWTLDTAGSAGVEWVGSHGRSRLVVGSCDDVYAVDLALIRGNATVNQRNAVQHLLHVRGCVTAIEKVADEQLAMTLYTFGGAPRLYLVELSE